jgi:hypothetical protein
LDRKELKVFRVLVVALARKALKDCRELKVQLDHLLQSTQPQQLVALTIMS